MLKFEKDGKEVIVVPPPVAVRLLEETCERTGLNWKLRHVYLVKRGGKWQVTLSIDGFRLIANSDENYAGQAGPFWTMGPGEPWLDIPPDKQPYAAKVGVYRKGQAEPTWGVAKFSDYDPRTPIWRKFPSTMIAKCAEMLALRKALPGKLGGLYGDAEMDQADVKTKAGGGRTPSQAPEHGLTVEQQMEAAAALSSAARHSVQNNFPDTLESYFEAIAAAATREALLTVGKEISKSSLGLEAKMSLSQKYNSRKAEMGWT